MPRKRRTRVTSDASSPSGNEASSSSSDERQRYESIDLYLKDFDMKVTNYAAQARGEAKRICSAINSAFQMEIMKLPKSIREMTIGEFMARGGSINNTALEDIAEATDSIASSISAKMTSTAAKDMTCSSEDTDAKAGKTKKGSKSRKKTAATKTAEAQTVRRSTRRKTARNLPHVTPATKMGKLGAQTTGWDTPMITPKFDPRLPVTPSTCVMREAKRGETIISLGGSPIIPNTRDVTRPEAVIPLGDGSSLTIGTSSPQMDMAMDQTTRRNILLLQSNLAKILKKCPVQA